MKRKWNLQGRYSGGRFSLSCCCLTATLLTGMALFFFFLPRMNPYWHIMITQRSQFTLRFILGVAHSMSSDKCTMTYIHHYDIIQTSFTALKILCALPICLSTFIHPNPGNHRSFYCFHSFSFSGMSYSYSHTVCSLFRLASFTRDMPLRFLLHVFSWLDDSFLFSTK